MLEDVDIFELRDRYSFLIGNYADLAIELAPKLEQFGKYKKELELISAEFISRGAEPDDPESLKKLLEGEIAKRTQTQGNEVKT